MSDPGHSDIWEAIGALAKVADKRIGALEDRIKALEAQTPQARQLQHEADLAAADLAASPASPRSTSRPPGRSAKAAAVPTSSH